MAGEQSASGDSRERIERMGRMGRIGTDLFGTEVTIIPRGGPAGMSRRPDEGIGRDPFDPFNPFPLAVALGDQSANERDFYRHLAGGSLARRMMVFAS